MQSERGQKMAAASLLPRSSPQPPAESPSAAPPAVEAAWPVDARIQSAQQTGEQFLRFMAAANRPLPPIWNSPAIQSSAGRLRHDLHANGDLRLSPPQWRIQQASAALSATYTLQGDAFSLRVRTEVPTDAPLRDAMANMRAIDAVFRSVASGHFEAV